MSTSLQKQETPDGLNRHCQLLLLLLLSLPHHRQQQLRSILLLTLLCKELPNTRSILLYASSFGSERSAGQLCLI
jgi:hypothetical protein